VSFIVNSSPGAGLRFEASVTLPTAKEALSHATSLSLLGMRQIRMRDTETGEVFDESALRSKLSTVKSA